MAHSQAPFPAMTTSRDAPNPLRPYYVPPSIGLPPDAAANATYSAAASKAGIGSSARDMLSDLDYGAPFFDTDGPSVADMGKKILDQALWKYTSVLLAQPFDVAKTILQVRSAAAYVDGARADLKRRQSARFVDSRYQDVSYTPLDGVLQVTQADGRTQSPLLSETESDEEEPSYFTPTKPQRSTSRYESESPSRRARRRRQTPPSGSDSSAPTPSSRVHKLDLRRPDSLLETLSQLWQHSGATGMWKATNATFIYNVLVKAVEGWTRSLLSALLNLPDSSALAGAPSDVVAGAMGGLDVADSPSPLLSLGVAVASASIAGLLLAPLDLIRTRLILTPTSTAPRAILPSLRLLPSLTVPSSLLPVTILHSSLPTLLTSSIPLILRQHLHIDPLTTPATYSLATFVSSTTELFLKLPLETVLRRGQVAVLKTQHARAYSTQQHNNFRGTARFLTPQLETVVDAGEFRGVFGTIWHVVYEEGVRESGRASVASTPAKPGAVKREKKGQGLAGLVRGWRIGVWGLVGVWGASALGGGGRTGGEF
ncbi:hypothetical protein MBLNU459_g1538t1 [Dothideomycetes sp. NU459]